MNKEEAIKKIQQVIKKFGTRLDLKKKNFHLIRGKYFYYDGKLPERLNIDYAGMPLGTFNKKGIFKPSLMLLEEIYKNTNKVISLDDKKAWLFSCNRDIFGNGEKNRFKKRDFVLVKTKKGDFLGFAIVKNDGKNPKKVWLENILDVGDYIRRENKRGIIKNNKRFK